MTATERVKSGDTLDLQGGPVGWAGLPDLIGPALLVAFFVVVVLLVPPRGEFAISDDWDYFATVGDLLHYGEIRLSDWPAMTLVGQILWGGLFGKLFGLSYMTLRFSVISLTFVGTLALYYWGRAIKRSRIESLFLGMLYATSPLVFNLSYSFMTDVPGASLMLLCLLIQAHCVRRGGVPLYLLAGITAGAGYLVRQTSALPALVLAVSLIPAALRRRARAYDLMALTVPLGVVVAWHHYWLDHIHGRPYQSAIERLPLLQTLVVLEYWDVVRAMLVQTIVQSLVVCVYLTPLLLCLAGRRARRWLWRSSEARLAVVTVFVGVPALMCLMGIARFELPPPYTQYINGFYLGFESLRGFWTLRPLPIRVGSFSLNVYSMALTLIGVSSLSLAAGLLLVELRSRMSSWRRGERCRLPFSPGVQAGLCGLVLMGLVVVQKSPFDRYLIPVIPIVAMFLLSLMPRGQGLLRSPLSWGLVIIFAAFSVLGTQDYFVRGRARLQAVNYLLQSGVKPQEINAGLEHAGLYSFSPHYRQRVRVRPYLLGLPEDQRWSRLKTEDPSLIWRRPREYELSYDPVAGSEALVVFSYRSWIRSGRVFVYHWPERSRHD